MHRCWIVCLVLLLAACGRQQVSTASSQAQQPQPSSTATPAKGLVPTPPREVPPVVYEKPDRSGKFKTRLHLKPQPQPTYQAPGPARPAHSAISATPSSAPQGPDTAALFGVRKAAPAPPPSTTPTAKPSPPSLPPKLAQAQEQAYKTYMNRPSTSLPPQALPFSECAKRLQGAVAGNAHAKLVQNDAAGYVVEMAVGNRVERMTCDRRTNTVSLSLR